MASFRISKLKSLVDELINVQLYLGKIHSPKITLRSYIDDKDTRFSSLSYFYKQKESPILDLAQARSIGGSYLGVEPMGFIWGMQPEPGSREGCRLLRRNASEPINVNLEAYSGHLELSELSSKDLLCSANLKRTYLSDNVERIPISHGRLRGTLFVPKNYQSCPAILDLFGMGGGIMEFRAALLASKGFVTLSLPFFAYDDLPKRYTEMDMTYFEEGIDFLLTHPKVNGDKVGTIGTSKGGELVCMMSILFPEKVRATVVVNGLAYLNMHSVTHGNEHFPSHQYDMSNVESTPRGLSFRESTINNKIDEMMPVERFNGDFLFINSLEDHSVPLNTVDMLAERLTRAGKHNFEIVRYPGAGHLLEPPYAPVCDTAYVAAFDILVNYGGNPYEHHLAQDHFWTKLQNFFHSTLGEGKLRSLL